MRSLLIALLFGCGGSTPPPAPVANTAPPPATPAPAAAPAVDPSSFAGIRAKLNKFADDMCVCNDSVCAQGVSDAMTKWGQDMTKNAKQTPKMSEQETKDFTKIAERLGTCMQAAMSSGSGATP
jgi:hypothetical protein